jgi:hypothetical protein
VDEFCQTLCAKGHVIGSQLSAKIRCSISQSFCPKIHQIIMQDLKLKFVHCSQFHQHFTRVFFVRKCFFCQNISREKLFEALSYKKRVRKMFMKLTPGCQICVPFAPCSWEVGRKWWWNRPQGGSPMNISNLKLFKFVIRSKFSIVLKFFLRSLSPSVKIERKSRMFCRVIRKKTWGIRKISCKICWGKNKAITKNIFFRNSIYPSTYKTNLID